MTKKIDETKNKKVINNKLIGILYSLCAFCWIMSGIIDLKKDSKDIIGYVDIGLAAVWILMAVLYFKKGKS